MSFVQLLNFSTLCLAALSTPGLLVFIVLGNPGFTPEFKSLEQKSERNEADKNIEVGNTESKGLASSPGGTQFSQLCGPNPSSTIACVPVTCLLHSLTTVHLHYA